MDNSSLFSTSSTLVANSSEKLDAATLALIEVYFQFELASIIILVLLAVVTIPTNIVLLVLIRMDPLKCFNKPTTPFIVGLAVADLLTGLTTEPFFAIYYYARHINPATRNVSPEVMVLYRIGTFASTVAISSSFLIVLALSWSQYIAVAFPHRYSTLVTRKRVTVCVCGSWMYFFGFSLLHFTKIDEMSFLKADLVLHPTLISAILLVTSILLYRSFQQEVQRKRSFVRSKNDQENKARKEAENIERQFTIVTIYLAGILLASALPHVVIQYVWLYGTFSVRGRVYVSIFIRLRDLLLFLKVALDAFIYAWRLKTYRETLQHTLKCCVFERKTNEENGSHCPVTSTEYALEQL